MNNGKIKVIELIPELAPGGAETMVKDYCLLIDRKLFDIQVVVIDHRYHSYNERALEDAGIGVTYLSELLFGADTNYGYIKKFFRKISRYIYWRKLVMSEQPDIIHAHLHLGAYLRILPLNRINCRLVMTIHNVLENYFSKERKRGDKYREYKEVQRLVDNHNMNLIALHKGLEQELKVYFATDRVATINNGIILDRFKPNLYDRSGIRRTLGIEDGTFVIGNVASFSYQKNHDLIVDVYSRLIMDYPNTKLLLIGHGKLKEAVVGRIKALGLDDRVIVLSNRGDIPELMSAMDVFFFPSRWEGFGNVLIEAQSMGLKCVISDVIPKETYVSDKVIALGLDAEPQEWIMALMSNELPYAIKEAMIGDYDMVNCVRKLESLYRGMCV